jgi:hypothetical protein
MKLIKTINTYSEEVRNEYLKLKESDDLREEIYDLTPANIRSLCLNLLEENLSEGDISILTNFFKINKTEQFRNKIERFDIDKLRPICRFLRKQQQSLNSREAIDLIALCVNFAPRPYRSYRRGEVIIGEKNDVQVQVFERKRDLTERFKKKEKSKPILKNTTQYRGRINRVSKMHI